MATEFGLSENHLAAAASKANSAERFLVAFVLGITAATYAATVRFEFVYDDQGQIVENPLVQSWRFVPQYFKGHVWQQLAPNSLGNYYRPLNVLWFRLNDALFGLRPAGWHATAILLHVLATFLAYLVARELTSRPVVAAAAALIFGVHPMRHEVVAWVSGTTESLWAVFCFGAFLAYLQSRKRDRSRWLAVSAVLYAAALLAKETAIVLPALVFAHAWIYGPDAEGTANSRPQRAAKAASTALVYVPVAIAYVGVRLSVLQGFAHSVTVISLRQVAFTLPSVLFFYLRQWFVPIHFAEFYALPVVTRFGLGQVVLPGLVLAAFAALLWLVRKKLGPREVGFATVWMIISLLPALDLGIFPSGQLVHDRYFYFPSFGAALLLALLLDKLTDWDRGPVVFGQPRALTLALLGVIIVLCYSSANAASYWQDDLTLFRSAYATDPGNALVRNNLAIELARRMDYGEAIPMLRQVLVDEPNNWLANYNLGRVYYNLGQLDGAEHYLERAQQINPALPDSYLQLGLVALRTNHLDVAEANMRKAVELRPLEPKIHFALGVTLETRGNCAEARPEFQQALALQPSFAQAQEQLNKCTASLAGNGTTPSARSGAPGGNAGLDPASLSGTLR
jgi:tetratricopeptide (TPR) repeat protein